MSAELRTTYLGLELESPLVASASPLTGELETLRALEQAGAAAVVLPSLFEEQIEHESVEVHEALEHGTHSFAEALTYFPELDDYNTGPDAYLEHLAAAKTALGIPVIASLNGVTPGGWLRYAELAQEAGADAIELNVYHVETDPYNSGAAVEDRTLRLVSRVRSTVSIPVAVKLSPFFTSLHNVARRLAHAGAQGLVLFNRFYQPDLDIEALEVVPHLVLSDSDELRLPLRWIAILYGQVSVDLALTSGVHTAEDALKGLMAGASVTMLASELLRHGIGRLRVILFDIEQWLIEHEYDSVMQLRGSLSQAAVANPAAFERAQYIKLVGTLELT